MRGEVRTPPDVCTDSRHPAAAAQTPRPPVFEKNQIRRRTASIATAIRPAASDVGSGTKHGVSDSVTK